MNKMRWLLVALLGLALAVGAYRFFLDGPWDRHTVAGIAAYEQGDYAKAEEEWVAALAEAEAFGPEDTRLATSLNNLGEVYRTQAATAMPSRFTIVRWPSMKRLLALTTPTWRRASTTWRCSMMPRAATKRPSLSTSARWRSI